MDSPALVLVHGGEHSADCWDLTVDELRRRAPELTVLAVDLPGHGATPGDLAEATISDWVRSAVAQIEDAGLEDVVVVGHSLAGLTVPGVVAKLGPSRVHEMILAACSVPAQGTAIVDTLSGPLAWYVRRAARLGSTPGDDAEVARYLVVLQWDVPCAAQIRVVADSCRVTHDRHGARRSQRSAA